MKRITSKANKQSRVDLHLSLRLIHHLVLGLEHLGPARNGPNMRESRQSWPYFPGTFDHDIEVIKENTILVVAALYCEEFLSHLALSDS